MLHSVAPPTANPLVTVSGAEIRGVGRQNGFTYEADPNGLTCPFGAHIRRANPRSADMPRGRQGLISWLLRTLDLKHGRAKTPSPQAGFTGLSGADGNTAPSSAGRAALQDEATGFTSGIYFISLNANISRQFEFIQNAWMVNCKFDGLDGESDPLVSNRVASSMGQRTDGFSLPEPSGPDRRISRLPQFVTVHGGAYFFLPSIRAWRFFARQCKTG